ncbi:type IV toxin-antitoxin system AbiEi family antitoxin domain-containing protein [Skermania sp. ID1734]|uniref:type IV toxin-antitoxin system AbiEi family antitoxin domain-containing protein n=1 Tax=Skermania sp. ID1734 TaxID=2597516 RepID=UPI00117CDEDA|nr:type IV toxin-antitoxin system AbiEi family antitoxin domain-containing protein [Skermania sp. ID1734]TSD93935.1 type IV toxin-antitoxin system AbiEi family antitoxin domain-containing protein [Skermania sp. ID1734]
MLRPNLAELATKQNGAFTWQQALLEYTRSEIETLVRNGRWLRIFRGVYRELDHPETLPLRIEAARLSLNAPYVVACRETAAQLYGFGVVDSPKLHLLTPSVRVSRTGLVVHRDAFADATNVRGVMATSPPRTAVDLARTLHRLDALATLDRAIRWGIPRSYLLAELPQHAHKPGLLQATKLIPLANGLSESPMESRTRLRCIDAGLPHPEPQLEIWADGTLRRVDLGWREYRIALEYESGTHHSGAAATTRDNARHNWLINQGWTVFYATATQVYRSPEEFTEPIRRAMQLRV